MKTEELILNLSKNLSPVKKISSLKSSYLILIFIFSILSTILVYFFSSHFKFIHIPIFPHEIFLFLTISFFSIFHLIENSYPTKKNLNFNILFFLILVYPFFLLIRNFFAHENRIEFEYHNCVTDFYIIYIFLFFINTFFLTKRFPIHFLKVSLISSILEFSVSSICLLLLCSNEEVKHLFKTHFLIGILSMIFSTNFKYIFLRFYFKKKLSFN